jgi:hypothetical protein
MRGNALALGAALLTMLGCGGAAADGAADPFTPAQVVSAATGQGATPMFAVGRDGSQVLSWVAPDGPDGVEQLHVQVTARDGSVTGSVLSDPLGSIEPHGEAPPQVVVGSDGVIHALYTVGRDVGKRFPESALRYVRSDDNGRTWSEPLNINTGEAFGSHNFHSLLAADGGRLYAAWLSSSHGRSAVWIRSSVDGGSTWDSARALHEAPTCPCCRTGLAAGANGELYASWRKIFDGDVRDIVVARSADGGREWETPVRPREDNWVFPGCPHAGPSLKTDANGNVHIAWWTGVENEAGVWYAGSRDGGRNWQPQPIAVGKQSIPAHIQMALGEDGTIVLVWDDGLGNLPTVTLRASRDGGATFGPAFVLSEPGIAATYPVIGLAGDSVVVAWTQVADSAYRAMVAERPDMKDPNAKMALPRVGQQEVVMRKAALADVLEAGATD